MHKFYYSGINFKILRGMYNNSLLNSGSAQLYSLFIFLLLLSLIPVLVLANNQSLEIQKNITNSINSVVDPTSSSQINMNNQGLNVSWKVGQTILKEENNQSSNNSLKSIENGSLEVAPQKNGSQEEIISGIPSNESISKSLGNSSNNSSNNSQKNDLGSLNMSSDLIENLSENQTLGNKSLEYPQEVVVGEATNTTQKNETITGKKIQHALDQVIISKKVFQGKVVIGQPVTWTVQYTIFNPTNQTVTNYSVILEIPGEAFDLNLKGGNK